MSSVEQKFRKLVIYWEIESNNLELNQLLENNLKEFKDLQTNVHNLIKSDKMQNLNPNEQIIYAELCEQLIKMVDFLINDIFDLRIQKILDKCQKLEIINENLLLPNELEFYKNVSSAFKGYIKTRNLYEIIADACKQESSSVKQPAFCQTENFETDINKIKYVLVEAIENVPPLVGLDFINYGPLNIGDICYLPEINAKILQKEKFINIIQNYANNN